MASPVPVPFFWAQYHQPPSKPQSFESPGSAEANSFAAGGGQLVLCHGCPLLGQFQHLCPPHWAPASGQKAGNARMHVGERLRFTVSTSWAWRSLVCAVAKAALGSAWHRPEGGSYQPHTLVEQLGGSLEGCPFLALHFERGPRPFAHQPVGEVASRGQDGFADANAAAGGRERKVGSAFLVGRA